MTTVALDGFGAERGPETVVEAARFLAGEGVGVRVFGSPGELSALEGVEGVALVACEERITNDDEPVRAIRSLPGASIVRAAADVAAGRSAAVVSAGPTGATLAAATFGLGRIPGIQRPALAARIPIPGAPVLLLDCGANSEVRSQHLVQFAILGAAFSRAALGVDRPRVALLSNGEEAKKGTPALVEAHGRLAETDAIDFVGNVEGTDLGSGAADVVVTDGFTGNVTLKVMEGTARVVGNAVRAAARSNPVSALGGLLLRPALGGMRRTLDPNTTGGAVLLGVRSPAVVAHGSTTAEGLANAARLAARCVEERAVERTAELLRAAGFDRASMREGAE